MRELEMHKRFIFMKFSKYVTGAELDNQLGNWLDKAELSYGPARGIIAVRFSLI
jgi:hypothetical protein